MLYMISMYVYPAPIVNAVAAILKMQNAQLWAIALSLLQHLFCSPATLLKKKTLVQVFSCEFCEISKNNFFTERPRTTASDCLRSKDFCGYVSLRCVFLSCFYYCYWYFPRRKKNHLLVFLKLLSIFFKYLYQNS